ncbi:hypothetical protein FBZ89_101414 [Nitrospirillum amazonense]|uniref:Uncharacterized protein n=1 Tax=Nitrospirillum amazonense TaxID=28077 RepID=A0A560FT22_9PROT|nr:hypothetical protein [Nitrospirillum amazonense]TWB24788.1 hypothetical protein FBZ89_101414 [Nitrospirillum amazonense]
MTRFDKFCRIALWVLGFLLIVGGCMAIFPALFLTVVAANDSAQGGSTPGMVWLLMPLVVAGVPVLILLSARKFPAHVKLHALAMLLAWAGALYLLDRFWLHR